VSPLAADDIGRSLCEFFDADVYYSLEVCVTLYLTRMVLAQGLMPGFLRIRQLADLQLEDRPQPPPKDGCPLRASYH
jgi:hypothetical protein